LKIGFLQEVFMAVRAMSFVVAILLPLSAAQAEPQPDLPLPADVEIVVDTYDGATKTFAVFSKRFPCEGYSYVTPEALVAGVGAINAMQLRKDPKSVSGKEFETTAELSTVSGDDIEKNHAAQSEQSALDKICSN
jgi:hypothetical protein